MMLNDFYSTKETCEILGISTVWFWQLRKKGVITGITLGRNWLFKKSDVEKLKLERQNAGK